jgi:Tol biopolymer transport system component
MTSMRDRYSRSGHGRATLACLAGIVHPRIVVLALLLVGCTTASTETLAAPDSSAGGASHQPTHLDGRIIIADGDGAFHVADADGSNLRDLSDPEEICCLAEISTDRSRILTMPGSDFQGAVRGGTFTLDGSTFELLPRPDPTLNLVPQAWSPDGTRIAFEGWDESDPSRTGIYTARAGDGGDLVRVTTNLGRPHDSVMDYSPDGTKLVFYRAIKAEPHFPIDLGGSLWIVNVDGSHEHKLDTGEVKPWWYADWSPDGSKILFGIERLQPTGGLWTIEPDGSNLTKVFEGPTVGFAVAPLWSPDGSKIMFGMDPINDAFEHVDNEVYVVNSDGTGLKTVIGGTGWKRVMEWWA